MISLNSGSKAHKHKTGNRQEKHKKAYKNIKTQKHRGNTGIKCTEMMSFVIVRVIRHVPDISVVQNGRCSVSRETCSILRVSFSRQPAATAWVQQAPAVVTAPAACRRRARVAQCQIEMCSVAANHRSASQTYIAVHCFPAVKSSAGCPVPTHDTSLLPGSPVPYQHPECNT